MNRQVEMDVMCELASEIVESYWYQKYHKDDHSFMLNDELAYKPEAKADFNRVLDIIDDVLNGVDAPDLGVK